MKIIPADIPRTGALKSALFLAAGLLSLAPLIAMAEEALPNPASIDLPKAELLSDNANKGKSMAYFFLTNSKVSFAEAFADFSDCYRFLPTGPLVSIPAYIPWTDAVHPELREKSDTPNFSPSPYGIIGDAARSVMQAIFLPGIEAMQARDSANNRLRMCMIPRGYVAHPISKEVWIQINKGNERDTLLRQAKLATMFNSHTEEMIR